MPAEQPVPAVLTTGEANGQIGTQRAPEIMIQPGVAQVAASNALRRGERQTQALADWASRGDQTDRTYPW